MGRRRRAKGAPIHGVVLVDKPEGLTSRDVAEACRRAYGAQRAGHTGTLDPMATGLLVVCLGDATRFVPFLTGLDKAYDATIQLGFATTTDDREGEPLDAPVEVTPRALEAATSALEGMQGTFQQVPPRVSAIKVDGRRSYDRAREGEAFELPARPVTVHTLNLLGTEPTRLRVHVSVSKGTFIRSIARDVGAAAGCGGHLATLRRTSVGAVDVSDAHALSALVDDDTVRARALLSPFAALAHLPAMAVDASACSRLRFGQRPQIVGADAATPTGTIVRVTDTSNGEFLGLAEVEAIEEGGTRLRAVRLNPTGEAAGG